eukprot:gnl/TRDRNA2_/TRDRNA2_176922_c4_seq2.p1 gnl/TRDRNA2_/TRDRNA2_176922_c4~~gnl/TRDRNA2_/TRDRNA2_176922_c4_seq2.p1  ORF type:complete len:101 (-),score=8.24 gnl/TRDRNA2_/TRDRNA2_176922_c4_seq2:251-553(-)
MGICDGSRVRFPVCMRLSKVCRAAVPRLHSSTSRQHSVGIYCDGQPAAEHIRSDFCVGGKNRPRKAWAFAKLRHMLFAVMAEQAVQQVRPSQQGSCSWHG